MPDTSVVNTIPFDTQLASSFDYLDKNIKRCAATKTVDAMLKDADGKIIFEKKNVEAPQDWSQLSINIAAEKYFIKTGPNAERSINEMCHRVAREIGHSGLDHNYFSGDQLGQFVDILVSLLENQYFCFNSPVWFNVGVYEKPWRISACFILGIEDNMESILDTCKTEGMIYKLGSGSGINYSKLRGKGESLSKGGVSSGVMSFVKMHDGVAGSIKSGGSNRRAAKMIVLNIDHPDIEEFIESKTIEEGKAQALIAAGYDSDFRAENGAYATVGFQNANHSARVTDEFMEAVSNDKDWDLKSRITAEVHGVEYNKTVKTVRAKELFHKIADAAWRSGDPGLQFDDITNQYNTLESEGRINGSNPCSEFCQVDYTSCNLASINLLKFYKDGRFDFDLFEAVVRMVTLALDILICDASYPTEQITRNSKAYRQIGLGYANLGALLAVMGIPYNSKEGRELAEVITAIMNGAAYAESADIASKVGAFEAYKRNQDSIISVVIMHLGAADSRAVITKNAGFDRARDLYKYAVNKPLRNSYVTNLAPTGTIGLVMGCDTTGIEPELALVKYKKMIGGGVAKLVSSSTERALYNLGYKAIEVDDIIAHIEDEGTLFNCPHIKEEHKKIFDTSFGDARGEGIIPWKAHIDMMAAVQPFLSGAISKTVNMPASSTVEDIEKAYIYAWESGLKCIAIYRDGCKGSQPVTTKKDDKKQEPITTLERKRLPDCRPSLTHKFSIAGHEGYLTVGLYEDGKPGEIFVTISKEGTFVSGLLDAWATMVSIALQFGAPLELLVDKLKGHTYDPQGVTANPDIRIAKSITDYIARFLALKFLGKSDTIDDQDHSIEVQAEVSEHWGNPCPLCSGVMYQAGTCEVCSQCGNTSGCS